MVIGIFVSRKSMWLPRSTFSQLHSFFMWWQNSSCRKRRPDENRLARPRDPPEWAADGSSPVCMSCGTRFTMLRRRHHCRACGRLLCASCTPHRVPLPATFSASSTSSTEPSLIRLVSSSSPSNDGAETRLHRVCNDCFNLVNAASYDGNTRELFESGNFNAESP
ncbi:unnamed protein product [Mesocestoides corti]|uniref:FYVE-type domain-containing protein n=1 Tax=Mesocestoides corti TaxID=53468 RepID=A0A0R3UHR0_MESCO|nr:unnamed protein product [Mesocestoides corti]